MYLQITTKCNMTCAHCCFSCRKGAGVHMDYATARAAINCAGEYDEFLTLGGGEPTMHPQFFQLLHYALQDNYVWFATNGKKTRTMRRLADILCGEDYHEEPIFANDKLTVTLSQDPWHEAIDDSIASSWKRWAKSNRNFEIRNTTNSPTGVIKQGRAKKTGVWQIENECVCATFMIKPDGNIYGCGCPGAPVIGDIYSGINDEQLELLESNIMFEDTRCTRDFI